ncbi:MAG: DUF2079 domain-containing protein [Ktedonobacterales bacterium]|nr:DUF2079 domain-containing protein [Ktedonobacterales bacterium]
MRASSLLSPERLRWLGSPTAQSPTATQPPTATTRTLRWHSLIPHLSPLGAFPAKGAQRLGMVITLMLMGGFIGVFLTYLLLLHQTLGTNGEDLGIMDQVLWNTTHQHFWHQTICNAVTDTNCLGDVSRWGIHFEPLMLALVPLYWLAPSPATLQIVQVFGVALGALPAYWLGSRRFHHAGAGILTAAAYLLMPVLRVAVVDDFHMVTLAAPLLMFALYFLYARNPRGLIITCLLALGTKEQIPLDVAMIGAAACLLQQRWRLGLGLISLAVVWGIIAAVVIHLASPIGKSPTAMRYDDMNALLQRLLALPTDPTRLAYLRTLFANTGKLALFAPWMLLLALPAILLNTLSADPHQYSGLYQYNADIAPFLVVAAMEGVATAATLIALASRVLRQHLHLPPQAAIFLRRVGWTLLGSWAIVNISVLPQLYFLNPNTLPPDDAKAAWQATWPQQTDHSQGAQRFFAQMPHTAAVSAQANLVPHLSERRYIYQFPSGIANASYILLDVEGNYYPELTEHDYIDAVEAVFATGEFTVVDSDDGYLLLQRAHAPPNADRPTLPAQFCATQPLQSADAIMAMHLIGNCDPTDGMAGGG